MYREKWTAIGGPLSETSQSAPHSPWEGGGAHTKELQVKKNLLTNGRNLEGRSRGDHLLGALGGGGAKSASLSLYLSLSLFLSNPISVSLAHSLAHSLYLCLALFLSLFFPLLPNPRNAHHLFGAMGEGGDAVVLEVQKAQQAQ